jgi:glycine/D-amino acid oxidase-like deaminating enzyme
MDRRQFLHAAAGVAAAGIPVPLPAAVDDSLPRARSAIVIGAGIVGASIAWHLSKAGCEVTLLDRQGPAAQASGNSFAWLNASYFDRPDSYFLLRTSSLAEWHRVSDTLSFPVSWNGSLEWYHTRAATAELEEGVSRVQSLGTPARMIDRAQLAEVEPNLDPGTDLGLLWSPRDGAVDPAAATAAFISGAAANGANIVFPAEVTGLSMTNSGISISTTGDQLEADIAIVAAGASANGFARMLDLGTDLLKPATPGIIVTTRPAPRLINTIGYTTDSHFLQLDDGRIVLGEKAGAPQTESHNSYLSALPNEYPTEELATEHARRVIDTASRYVPELMDVEPERVGVGWRPLPLDGLPIVGHVPGNSRVYLAAMHSGVTLAPIVGHLATIEILDRVRALALADFRVERFL